MERKLISFQPDRFSHIGDVSGAHSIPDSAYARLC